MTDLDIDVSLQLEDYVLELKHSTTAHSLALFGPSGAGKTSALEVLAGWRDPERGRIVVGGERWFDSEAETRVPPERRGVGYVPQDDLLFPHWDVERNVRSGSNVAGRAPDAGLVERAIDVLGLGDLRRRSVDTLSGGERRRVALARALCSRPRLLLLDEPLGALDRDLARRVLAYVVRARAAFEVPLVLVSHSAFEVQALCDEVLVLQRGRVVSRGAPDEVLAERDDRGLEPFENALFGTARDVTEAAATVTLGPGAALRVPRGDLHDGARALVSMRADDVLLATQEPIGLSARNVLAGEVVRRVELQGEVRVAASCGAEHPVWAQVTAEAARELRLEPGRRVFLVVKTRSCRALAVDGPVS